MLVLVATAACCVGHCPPVCFYLPFEFSYLFVCLVNDPGWRLSGILYEVGLTGWRCFILIYQCALVLQANFNEQDRRTPCLGAGCPSAVYAWVFVDGLNLMVIAFG